MSGIAYTPWVGRAADSGQFYSERQDAELRFGWNIVRPEVLSGTRAQKEDSHVRRRRQIDVPLAS
jgi:hypothetical protein